MRFWLLGMVRRATESSGKIMDENIELRKKVIRLLKENNGEMEEGRVCSLLGIDAFEVPWGYNIGWARCIQSNQKYHLVLSKHGIDDDIGYTGVM